VRTHNKFGKIRSVLHQKARTSASEDFSCFVVRKMSAVEWPRLDKHPPPDCGHLLWTAPYHKTTGKKNQHHIETSSYSQIRQTFQF